MPDDTAPDDATQPADDLAEDGTTPDVAPEPDVQAAADGPGAWTALAAPGKPDGEVDTRS